MLGTLRLVLAVIVVANHLWGPVANIVGANAVVAFYIVSGFLITKIRIETYTGIDGIVRFFINRFLRIYPIYWIFCLLTTLGLLLFPNVFGHIHGAIRLPRDLNDIIYNIGIFGLLEASIRLVPPAWSLNVELIFYILIGLGLSRNKWLTYTWLATSIVFTTYLVFTGAGFGDRYTQPEAASLFFATGASLYHFLRGRHLPHIAALPLIGLIALFSAFSFFVRQFGGDYHLEGFYFGYLLFIACFVFTLGYRDPRWKTSDKILGDMAYPVFLNHFFAAGLTESLSGVAQRRRDRHVGFRIFPCEPDHKSELGLRRRTLPWADDRPSQKCCPANSRRAHKQGDELRRLRGVDT